LIALGSSKKILQIGILRSSMLTSGFDCITHISPVELGAGDGGRSVSLDYEIAFPALLSFIWFCNLYIIS
jgi:hypothetical protein